MNKKSDYSRNYLVWISKLGDCQFVGEIYLTIEELQDLASKVRSIPSAENKQDLILIIAVNCAYHFYDDEGFWKHFFNLLGMPNNITNRELYGSIMETRLKKRGLLKRERRGPFRYVGSILEQCAVSKKHIYSFASAVKELRNRYGWKGLSSIDYQQYLYFIRDLYCSKYLKNFLADPEGWDFTKQVARLCELYESGMLSQMDLEQLPGFQPDFWTEFLEVLGSSTTSTIRNEYTFLHKPFIFFNPDRLTVGLNLDSSVFVDYPVNHAWNIPITWLDQINLFSRLYSGRYATDDGEIVKWEITGWLPDGSPALFDRNWRYVNNDHVIPPGTYYFIASSLNNISCGLMETLGTVNLAGGTKYEAYFITINDHSMLPGYKIANKNDKNITLTWEDEAMYRFPCSVNSYPVFAERIPRIRISDFSLISNNMVGLLYDCGNGPHMIKTIQQLDAFYNDCQKMAPVKGRLWLEPLSRNRYLTLDVNMPELNFALIPKCRFVVEPELASSHESPVLTVVTNANCEICLNECIQMDNMSTKWLIQCMDNKISGKITFGNVDVFVEVPVYRTRLYYESGSFIDCIGRDDIPDLKMMIATGLPGQTLFLGLRNGKQVIEVGKFDEKGHCIFNSDLIKPLLENHSDPISEILIIHGGCSYRTGAVYIDVNRIKNINLSGEWPVEDFFSCTHAGLLKYCSSLCRSPASQVHIKRIPLLPACISEWIFTVFSCASVFDSTEFYIDEELWNPLNLLPNSELKTTLSLCMQCKDGSSTANDALDIDCIPKVDRWLKEMARLAGWHSVNERIKIINEWASQVAEKNPPYRNAISSLNGGQLLGSAWYSYLHDNAEVVPRLLNTVRTDSTIVEDLKRILESLIMFRFGRFERAGLLLKQSASLEEVEPVRKVLQTAVTIAQGEKAANVIISEEFSPIVLPLTDMDQNFVKNIALLAKDIEKAKAYGMNCQDWLFIWVLVMFLDQDDDRLMLAKHLLNIQSLIPQSPQRNDIINKLITINKEESRWTQSLQN